MKKIRKILFVFLAVIVFAAISPAALVGQTNRVEAAVKISKTKVTLIKGQTATLKISGTKKTVKWSSNKKTVATVNQKGKITAKKAGTAKIIAKIGSKKYTCTVIVQTPKINKSKATITVGNTYTLKVSGTDQKITWKSSKTSVATVNGKGVVTAKKAGTAKITATVLKKKYTCTVTVKKTTTSENSNPQDAILSKISKNFTVGKYYKSGWKNALICTYKNNSGYDLDFSVHVTFDNGMATGTDGINYFKNGTECIIIFDFYDFSKYKVEYTIKKTTESIKKLYENAVFSTFLNNNGTVAYQCTRNMLGGYNLDSTIVYYSTSGNIIDYDKISLWSSGEYTVDGSFETPVNRNLDTVPFAYYKTTHQIIQY